MQALAHFLQPSQHIRSGPICPPRRPNRPMRRIAFLRNTVSAWAWPSRGGLIVLERLTPVDLDFLGLGPLRLLIERDPDQDAEDCFCQQLLHLGAKWFDSVERCQFVGGVAGEDERCVDDLVAGVEEPLTTMERQWVCVGITSNEGLWVAEYDTPLPFVKDKHNLEPHDSAKVLLARTMDERCSILKGMGAKFYETIEQYDGMACLRAWEKKTTGEIGPFKQIPYILPSAE
ncbi:hypothetical protein OIDMADRAFT_173992 [Oidiodendron maius Zn]|uniref:Uncharacterized protein n=1 Tax=Oidiodendron maius (strain Zn) TaxID=913774 RepID=A0A0C3DXG7_OIDMZ|nr:hypothetical protein OIDMADRAFT_173992 [Oidiodendron maius Zn]